MKTTKPYLLTIFITLILLMLVSLVTSSLSDSQSISISLVNQDPDPAIAGDTVELRFGIANTGGIVASNLITELEIEYPFSLVSGQTYLQNVGTVNPYQLEENIKIVKYKLKIDQTVAAGTYEIKIKYYEQGSTIKKQKTFNVEIKNQENAEIIHIDQTTLIPGKQTTLKFTINNVGNAPLKNIRFYWQNSDEIVLPVGSDNTKYIKYLEMGESKDLEYQVIADTNAAPGLYSLDLYLTYDDPITNEQTNTSTIAGIYVGGETDFEVSFSEKTGMETAFSISNIGSNPAASVSILIPEQKNWKITGANSAIIGNLNKGDYTVASFSLEQDLNQKIKPFQKNNQTESGENTIIIQVAYTDTMGERKIVEKEVALNAAINQANEELMQQRSNMRKQNQGFFAKYKWHIIGSALIILLGIIYSKYKTKKLENPNFNIINLFKK
ncbi:hypothetical protein HN587_07130 [Candidatus Woesearchaeota archaeon]|mgnify:CR=1 FL=1|jgi:hypothetical protein|nr:hypothetical protein [Candidatus Woesearchaeota archaeon]